MRRIRTSSKAAVRKRRKEIKKSLRKAGIRSLQEVLNTSVLSNDAKIKHIRHTYTCYDKYLKTFYRDGYGVTLRNELNCFLRNLVEGKRTIDDLKAFNKELKEKLEIANDNYIEEQKNLFELNIPKKEISKKKETPKKKKLPKPVESEVEKTVLLNDRIKSIDYNNNAETKIKVGLELLALKGIHLSEREKEELSFLPHEILTANRSINKKIIRIANWLKDRRESWKRIYTDLSNRNTDQEIKYVVELYLENRSSDFYPSDFSDLNFLTWHEVKERASEWLLAKFDGDLNKYNDFMYNTLPEWVAFNAENHEDKVLEKLYK